MGKDELRRELRARRDAMPAGERGAADAEIARCVAALPAFAEADAVLCYLSFGSEVETRGIIARALAAGKTVALPRVAGPGLLAWHWAASLEGLVRSRLGMLEPAADPATAVDPGAFARPVAIVPGLAFDRAGYRIGYGGGFYDRFLADFPGISIGLARTAGLVADLAALGAVGPHDLPVDIVVTDGPAPHGAAPARGAIMACASDHQKRRS